MKILVVINNIYSKGNGLCGAVQKNVDALRQRGYQVRILSGGKNVDYPLEDIKMPFVQHLIEQQGFQFSKAQKDIIRKAVQWADIIHLEEPFILQIHVANEAKRQGVPCVGTYHIHPENLFASVGLQKSRFFNSSMLLFWKKTVYDKCVILQCPTHSVKDRLEKWHFKSELRVISNGIKPVQKSEIAKKENDFYKVICVGRFSVEKDQFTLLEAMRYSKYAKKIQFYFAGKGPIEKQLKEKAQELMDEHILKYAPSFSFYSRTDLEKLYDSADLYVHCATIEVEGLSCMEAIQYGVVPVIAQGKLTATSQFSKNKMSTYDVKDVQQLASRIDYWLENDTRRLKEAKKYTSLSKEYSFDKSIDALIQMYEDAIK